MMMMMMMTTMKNNIHFPHLNSIFGVRNSVLKLVSQTLGSRIVISILVFILLTTQRSGGGER